MPEMTFTVEWPDGSLQECYSPSLVMHDYLTTGESYPVSEFVHRVATALDEASQRVRAKYGFACTSASAQRDDIQDRAQPFLSAERPPEQATGMAGSVRVLAMEPQLPATGQHQKVQPQ
jgi:uncharacterized repeat protein (TIGR04042 family)